MRRRVVGGEQLVEGQDRSGLDVGLPAEGAGYLVQRAIELFMQPVHPLEQRLAGRLVGGEVPARELLEGGRVAVLGAPEARDLREAPLGARPLRLAVRGDELVGHPLDGGFEARLTRRDGRRGGRKRVYDDHERGEQQRAGCVESDRVHASAWTGIEFGCGE